MTEAGPVLSEIRCLATGQKWGPGKFGALGFYNPSHDRAVDDDLLRYLSPLCWEHINLTGDYLWRDSAKALTGFEFRFLRRPQEARTDAKKAGEEAAELRGRMAAQQPPKASKAKA